jgi:hypothetical protein
MTRLPICLVLLLALAAAPSAASAAPFRDTRLDPAQARAAAASSFDWTAPDGHVITLRLSRGVGDSPAAVARAEAYAALLEANRHSFEMSLLTVSIVRESELGDICGDGALACYGQDEMVVPYGDTDGASLAEVLAHEYGHHIAGHRRNSMGPAIDWGPQSWASAESVCLGTDQGRLHPGDESSHYWSNPGEGWAEAYAQLHYPGARWDYSKLLKPDERSFEHIAFDVDHQLSRTPSRTAFQGNLAGRGSSRTFSLELSQDSALRLALRGPDGSDYDLRLKTPGYYDEATRARGSRDRLNTSACFQEGAPRAVKVSVTSRRGAGPFELTASYYDAYEPL